MEIAKGIQSTDYLKLNLDISNISNEWNTAFDYLEKRITERFINPINKLMEAEDDSQPYEKTFGFAILALDCLLLETIQSFYEGITNSKGKSKGIFIRFLTQQEGFKEDFTTNQLAEDFYYKFRCGILHQTQTGSDTKVWSVGKLVSQSGNFLIINRVKFHQNIISVFNNYLTQLREKDNSNLLKNFKVKMDYIARN